MLRGLAPDGLAVSVITLGELYEGIYFDRDPLGSERALRTLLRAVGVIPVNRPIARRFARIRGELRRSGQLIGDADLLIAATAIHSSLTLVTRNRRHVSRVPGLSLLPPP